MLSAGRAASTPSSFHDVAVDRPLPERVLPALVHHSNAGDVIVSRQEDEYLKLQKFVQLAKAYSKV